MSTQKDEGTWQKPMARKCPNRGFPPHLSQSKGCTVSSLAHWHPRRAAEVSDGEEAILIFAPYFWNRAWQVVFIPSTFVKKRIWVGLWKGISLILRTQSHLNSPVQKFLSWTRKGSWLCFSLPWNLIQESPWNRVSVFQHENKTASSPPSRHLHSNDPSV